MSKYTKITFWNNKFKLHILCFIIDNEKFFKYLSIHSCNVFRESNASYRKFGKIQCISILIWKTFSIAIPVILHNVWKAIIKIMFISMTSQQYIHDVQSNVFHAKSRNSYDEKLHQTLNVSRRWELYICSSITRSRIDKVYWYKIWIYLKMIYCDNFWLIEWVCVLFKNLIKNSGKSDA